MTDETDALFEAKFALEDIRELLRQSAPDHELDDEQKLKLTKAIEKITSSAKRLEKQK